MNSFIVFTIVFGLAAYANALNDTNSTESGNSSSNATLDTVAIPESVHSNQMASSQKVDRHGASADNDHSMLYSTVAQEASSSTTRPGSVNSFTLRFASQNTDSSSSMTSGGSSSGNNSSGGSISGGNANSASGSSTSDTQGLSQTTEGTNTATTILGLHLSVASFLLAFYIA